MIEPHEKEKDTSRLNNNSKSLLILLVLSALIAYFFIKNNKTEPKKAIDLASLSYEAKKMGGKKDSKYLRFPSQDHKAVTSYLDNLPKMGFKPHTLKEIPQGWALEGAHVIDYGLEKLSCVSYKDKSGERVFLFSLKDKPELTQDNLFKKGELNYSLYASKEINMVLWKTSKSSLNVLVGWKSAKELIEFL